jgi:2-polyprenyl-3-methyl-5-hydroxy-6-metoxy-1,4-benzoquinol methylase
MKVHQLPKKTTSIVEVVQRHISDQQELSWFQLHRNRFIETLDLALKYIAPGSSLLEVGSAPGHMSVMLHATGYRVVALDKNPERHFSRYNSLGIPTVKVDLESEKIALPSDYFDAVLFTEVLEHIKPLHVDRVLEEIRRVLKTGGVLLTSTPNSASLDNYILGLGGKREIFHEHAREYRLSELITLISRSGFTILESFYSQVRDAVTHVGTTADERIGTDHVLIGVLKHPHWKNLGRAITLYPKIVFPPLRSSLVVVARKE